MKKKKHGLKSVKYFRDLGGIKVEDGREVKKGVLFRCCDFSKISKEDYDYINQNIFAIIDLRTDDEIKTKPDVFEKSSYYHHVPLLSNGENPAVTRETRNEILKIRMSSEGGMKKHISDLYVKLVKNDMAKKNFKEVFNILLSNKDGGLIAYHCTQGKDRTGMVSVLILLALGASKEDIVNDYLVYNKHNSGTRFWIKVGISTVLLSFKAARELNAALVARKRYIYSAFNAMEEEYGSAQNFLRQGIGLTEEEINKLKELYLVESNNN